MYNAPRWYQLCFTIHTRSTAGVEPWLFVTLLLQNFTLLAVSLPVSALFSLPLELPADRSALGEQSILSASQDESYLYAQSPYLTNIGLAIFADIVVSA